MVSLYPLRDMQDIPPRAYCRICGAELYEYDAGPICPECEEELEYGREIEAGHCADRAAQ